MYLEYKIYTHIDPPESGEHYFKILTANYSSAEYNKEGLLKFSQSVESLEEDSSDADLNLQTWDKLHEDWQEVYNQDCYAVLACPPKVVPSVKLVFVQTERNKEYDT